MEIKLAEQESNTVKIDHPHEKNIIKFGPGYGQSWIMKIEDGQIHLNRKDYPKALPDDFVKTFMEILERQRFIQVKCNL